MKIKQKIQGMDFSKNKILINKQTAILRDPLGHEMFWGLCCQNCFSRASTKKKPPLVKGP
jgi:hypothetical protein